ncbi:hypothetical protein [Bacteroides sedimenti]
MKKYFILVMLTISALGNCQSQVDLFNQFVKKFKENSFPITKDTFEKYDLYGNNICNITKQEFDFFVKNSNDKFWIYRLYSKKQPNYFNYVTGLKFSLAGNKDLVALIYFCSYLTDYTACISETILSIYDSKGNKKSSLPIAGGYGDTLSFSSKIHSLEKIEINYTKYFKKGEEKYTRSYSIQNDGTILQLKK